MVKIAVYDDEKELREVTAAWLRDYFAPQEVLLSLYDGGEALLRAVREEDCRFQLAVMDIKMGETDGITVGEELNLLLPACQIIYLTGYLDYAPDAYATRHVYYVYKPRMEEHLPKALEMALAALHEAENSRLVLPQKNGQLFWKSGRSRGWNGGCGPPIFTLRMENVFPPPPRWMTC